MSASLRALALVGPTASGKSRLGLEIAERFGLTILCCDSVQVYRGLDIGSAKPTKEERRRVPHELIDLVDPDQEFSAGDYARAALGHVAAGPAIFVGGTGFYLRGAAWTQSGGDRSEGESERASRLAFVELWESKEAAERGSIHAELARRDRETAGEIHPRNCVRALRALWLCEVHGRPVSALRREDPPRPRIELGLLVLDPGVEEVDRAIDRRCEAMLEAGWLAEVEKLWRAGYDARHKAMRSLGYHQLLRVTSGRQDLSAAITSIKAETRRYARRQRTYFRWQLPAAWRVELATPEATPWAAIERFIAGGTP
ncbi:MAG TPA: tRNA (adenosine(37)-N6)-dimethylallyltransferase MiaA [Nannocystis exedens]|nr:tRNA (adenosine(37)-N6)-dimethylallyltransferase MiaA [Nannocystis exedens]